MPDDSKRKTKRKKKANHLDLEDEAFEDELLRLEQSTADDFVLDQLDKYPPIKHLEIAKLFKKIKKYNCQKSRHEILIRNMRWAAKIAKAYRGRGQDYCDLFQEAMIGLNHAIDKYDHTKGYAFLTYATWWIREAITKALKTKTLPIRLPVRIYDIRAKVNKEHKRVCQDQQRKPTAKEIAEAVGITQQEAEKQKGYLYEFDSLDRPVHEDDMLVGDLIEDENHLPLDEQAQESQNRQYIRECLSEMKRGGRVFLERYFGIYTDCPRTLTEMAMFYGISEKEAEIRLSKYLRRLKKIIDKSKLHIEGHSDDQA